MIETPTPDASAAADPISAAGGQNCDDTQHSLAPVPAETIALIRAAHRERNFWMDQRKRSDLALGAYLRNSLGWRPDKPAAERKAIAAQALAIIAAGEQYRRSQRRAVAMAAKGRLPNALPEMAEALRPYAHIVLPTLEMRAHPDTLEASATRKMEDLARTLPVYAWVETVPGFAALGLAIIVAEAGDLADYPNPGKLWKRMGLAVIDGQRQGSVPGGLSREARAKAWIERKYSPVRRSRSYTIANSLLMSGNPEYRDIYLSRKAYEVARAEADGLTVAPASKIPKGKAASYRSLKHVDNRARRYTEKRLLRHVWQQWNRANRIAGEGAMWRMPQGHACAAPTVGDGSGAGHGEHVGNDHQVAARSAASGRNA
jgi:hypothetical protein